MQWGRQVTCIPLPRTSYLNYGTGTSTRRPGQAVERDEHNDRSFLRGERDGESVARQQWQDGPLSPVSMACAPRGVLQKPGRASHAIICVAVPSGADRRGVHERGIRSSHVREILATGCKHEVVVIYPQHADIIPSAKKSGIYPMNFLLRPVGTRLGSATASTGQGARDFALRDCGSF